MPPSLLPKPLHEVEGPRYVRCYIVVRMSQLCRTHPRVCTISSESGALTYRRFSPVIQRREGKEGEKLCDVYCPTLFGT